ncbi:MAG: glycerol acyltransferase [Chlorobi bacterium]|nr:glycerol acyltransferase [Chlorobiota bacterium]
MVSNLDFESIRPYNDSEIHKVFERLTQEQTFLKLLNYLYPDIKTDEIIKKLLNIQSIKQFQSEIMHPFVREIMDTTTAGVTSSGLDRLSPDEHYLYISNHRDIVLDPAILNILIHENGFDTCEIAIGDNLLIFPWITDLVKLNKTFIVRRNLPGRQMLEASNTLSHYIRHTLTERQQSIWIAQREGRSKDGDDRTQISLLKMLNISGNGSIPDNFKELNIVPVSLSYEYDPCDYLKAYEFQQKRDNPNYKKTQKDDLLHMGLGMRGWKGRVHFAFGKPLNKELDILKSTNNKNEQYKLLAGLIDDQIHNNYKLWPGNFVAADIISGNNHFKSKYTEEEKEKFLSYLEDHIAKIENGDTPFLRKAILEMYANPVRNFYKEE